MFFKKLDISENTKRNLFPLKMYFRKNFYENGLLVIHERRMRFARGLATVGFPVFYFAFIICFFAVGMSFYDGSSGRPSIGN